MRFALNQISVFNVSSVIADPDRLLSSYPASTLASFSATSACMVCAAVKVPPHVNVTFMLRVEECILQDASVSFTIIDAAP